MKKNKFSFVTLCFFCGGPALAQYIPPFQPALDINVAGSIYLGDEGRYDDLPRKRGAASTGSRYENTVSDVDLTYTVNKSRTAANLQNLVEKTQANDKVAAEQMGRLFASTDIIDEVNGVLDRFGLKRSNVAHAYALYWIAYWALANNSHDAPSMNAIQAVAAQASKAFATSEEFAAMSNEQKQAAAEELMALAAIMDASSEHAKSDSAFAAQLAKASLEGSRKSGLDLDKMTLTEDGFVPAKPKKRSDATDVQGEDKALASTAPADAPAHSPNYPLLVAIGGASLGGVFLLGKAMGRKG